MNPHNSPWNKPKFQMIEDFKLYSRWKPIAKHLTKPVRYSEGRGFLEVNGVFYIAKNSVKMRLVSHLDWCHYDAQDLANAIDSDTVEQYYEQQLNDPNSDPNQWRDKDKEMLLKTHYAAKRARASKI
jgi:hypothetical protein